MTQLGVLAREWLPPAVVRWARQARAKGVITYEGAFATWKDARAHCAGYESSNILEKVLDATLRVKRGEAVFERDSVLFHETDYVWPVLSGLLWAAARHEGVLNVLDFGGALGSSYFQNRRFLSALRHVRWNVVEQRHFVEAGRAQIQDEIVRFYESIEACLADNKPNVVLLSSVLQYVEFPGEIVRQLHEVGVSIVIIDRTPFSTNDVDKLVVQHVPKSIYEASYCMWIFSMQAISKLLDPDWRLVATTFCPEGVVRSQAGLEFSFQGMLLEARR